MHFSFFHLGRRAIQRTRAAEADFFRSMGSSMSEAAWQLVLDSSVNTQRQRKCNT